MEPASLISTLSKLIGLGVAFHKAHRSEGFDDDDMSALKAFLDTGSGLLSRKSRDDKSVGAIQLALVLQSFGAAMGQHWANNVKRMPAKPILPAWIGKIVAHPTLKRFEEIEIRMKYADLKLLAPETPSDPSEELERLRQLTSRPEGSPYYRALWNAFTNPKLDEEGIEPLFSLEKPGDAREFEKHFRVAYARAIATPAGREVQQWQIELSSEKSRALQHALMLDFAGWGRRHVFGNSVTQAPNDILPFMPLDDVYVEPFGRVADQPTAGLLPIKQLILELFKKHHLVVVKADFGHGKSLTARSLAKDLAVTWIADNLATGPELTVPVFIKCTRDIQEANYEHVTVVRRARWNHAIDALGIDSSIDDEAFDSPEQQKTLFILDGLDEISYSANQLRELFRRLNEKARGNSRTVVFTRPGALFHDCVPRGTPVVDLLPFQGREQIEAWIRSWNGVAGPDQQFAWNQVQTAGLEKLASTPILLLMIAMTVHDLWRGQGKTIIDKTELYERFFLHIARGKLEQDHGEQHRPIEEASGKLHERLVAEGILPDEEPPVRAMLWLMSRIAWRAHDHAYRPGGSSLSVKEVDVDILGKELGLKEDARRLVEVGLVLAMQIDPAGHSRDVLFGHQSFREFLVAYYWCHELRRLVREKNWRRKNRAEIDERLMEARLLQPGDAAFSMLATMLSRLKGAHEKDLEGIHDWAQAVSNDEELPGKSLREDRSSSWREAALAIGSCISPVELDDPMTLRSLVAHFYGQGDSLWLIAPGLICSGANLSGADLNGANLSGASLSGADLSGADLYGADLGGANLNEAKLYKANLIKANLNGVHLNRADLGEAKLYRVNMIRSSLVEASLVGANMIGASLGEANLSGANLCRAGLGEADLSRVNLNGANLRDASLSGADLRRADLSGVDLRKADLSGADLRKADLSGADLRQVGLKRADLNEARYNKQTLWPDGFRPKSLGALESP